MSTDHDLIIMDGDNAEGITYFEARFAHSCRVIDAQHRKVCGTNASIGKCHASNIEFRKRIRVGVHIIRSRKIRSSGLAGLVFRE